MEDNKNFVKKQTKIHPYINTRIEKIAKKKGISVYQMLQMVLDTLARYTDDRHNLTPEMEKAMSIFEHMDGWAKALNFADPSVQKRITEATYFFYDKERRMQGCRAVHVIKPLDKVNGQVVADFADWQQTINIQDILERTICLLMPERYSRLRKLAVDKECSSLVELIDTLIDEHSQDEDVKFFREAFEDAERSEFGKEPWKQPFKKHPNYSQQLNLKLEGDETNIGREDSSREEVSR